MGSRGDQKQVWYPLVKLLKDPKLIGFGAAIVLFGAVYFLSPVLITSIFGMIIVGVLVLAALGFLIFAVRANLGKLNGERGSPLRQRKPQSMRNPYKAVAGIFLILSVIFGGLFLSLDIRFVRLQRDFLDFKNKIGEDGRKIVDLEKIIKWKDHLLSLLYPKLAVRREELNKGGRPQDAEATDAEATVVRLRLNTQGHRNVPDIALLLHRQGHGLTGSYTVSSINKWVESSTFLVSGMFTAIETIVRPLIEFTPRAASVYGQYTRQCSYEFHLDGNVFLIGKKKTYIATAIPLSKLDRNCKPTSFQFDLAGFMW